MAAGAGNIPKGKERYNMSSMTSVKNLIVQCPILLNGFIAIKNRIHRNGNTITGINLHFQHNRIELLGQDHILTLQNDSFMRECHVQIHGKQNQIKISADTQIYGDNRQTFHIDGQNNKIVIGKNCRITGSTFFIWGSDNLIRIEDNCSICNTEFHIEQNQNEIHIGIGTTTHGREGHRIHMALDEGSKIILGEDCMLANGIQMRSSDSHSIVDLNGHRLNPAKDIVIGKHCWIGLQSISLKGSLVADACVIAAGSICSKKYEESNCVIAGNPAKIVKHNINWDRKFIPVE